MVAQQLTPVDRETFAGTPEHPPALSHEVLDIILARLATSIVEMRRSPGWPNEPRSSGMLLYEVLECLGFPQATVEVVVGYSIEEMEIGPPFCAQPAYGEPVLPWDCVSATERTERTAAPADETPPTAAGTP